MITIRLPWPPAKTSANASAQGDWRGKSKAAQSYKTACAWELLHQRVKKISPAPVGDLPVAITYHPPTLGRVDWDNLAGRGKAGWDAVAEAIGVDDGRWWPVTSIKGHKVKHGAIMIRFGAGQEPAPVAMVEIRGVVR